MGETAMTQPTTDPTPPVEPPKAVEPPVVSPPADPAKEKPEIDWKAEARKHEARAKENAGAAAKLAAIEEANKTEAQKLSDRAEAAEKRAAALELAALRSQAAMANGLPAEMVERLRGDTAESLAEDAAALAALLKASQPAGEVDQGVKGTGTTGVVQLTEADVKKLASEGKHGEIEKARVAGQLNTLLGIT